MQVNRKFIPPTAMMLRDPQHSNWNLQNSGLKELLGLDRKAKLPTDGMPARRVQGIDVWVDSLEQARLKKQFHRIRCACPYCGEELSAGRLHQHITKHV